MGRCRQKGMRITSYTIWEEVGGVGGKMGGGEGKELVVESKRRGEGVERRKRSVVWNGGEGWVVEWRGVGCYLFRGWGGRGRRRGEVEGSGRKRERKEKAIGEGEEGREEEGDGWRVGSERRREKGGGWGVDPFIR
jgi:hypothetical protein